MEDAIIQFLNTAEKLKSTLRHNWTTTGRQESDAEHTWRVALFFILIHEIYHFDVDPYKTLKMILIHDMPEMEFGDIAGFIKDTNIKKHVAHKEREAQAAKKLFSQLPAPLNKEFLDLFEEFETNTSNESKVSKALERIESQLQHLNSGPQYWSEEEKGNHMLTYPNAAVEKLNHTAVTTIWHKIRDRIASLTL